MIALWLGGLLLTASVVLAARRSLRSGAALFAFYLPQALLLAWVGADLSRWGWPAAPIVGLVFAALLAHRLTTYAFPLPPGPVDRVWFPLVHTLQTATFVGVVAWPLSRLAPASPWVDAAVSAALLVGSAGALWWTHSALRLAELRVPIQGLARAVRVVQISDLHVGPYTPAARLTRIADEVRRLEPDLVALTGDLLTLRSELDLSGLRDFFARLPSPPLGVWACLGNHDVAAAAPLRAACEAHAVGLLVDAFVDLAPLRVVGLDWHPRKARYPEALAPLVDHRPVLLLCHDPAAFPDLTAWNGLMLAGHLHGGQVELAGHTVTRLLGLRDQGLHRQEDRVLYVHRGTGTYGFPVRVGVPPEIALLVLEPAGA